MKLLISFVSGILISGCAIGQPATAKFTVRVLNFETDQPVTNAVVQSYFEERYDPWGNEPSIVKRQKVPVDKDGEAVLEGKDIKGGAGGTAFAEGYYSGSAGKSSKRKNLALNRWEPWNPTIEVKLRPKKNPMPMIQKGVERKKIPAFGKAIGFDLGKSDWVGPYGKGVVSDFIFHATTNIAPKKGIHYILSFQNPKDGIQEYMPPKELRSSFVWPYEAPLDSYESKLDKYFIFHFPKVAGSPFHNIKDDKVVNYIFRTRTQLDDEGKIVTACYGRIKGEIRISSKGEVYFNYWFNPDSHSRSLESDKKPY